MTLLSLALGAALAAGERANSPDHGLLVAESYPLPAGGGGYRPLQFRVESRRFEPAEVTVQARLEGADVVVSRSFMAAPGEITTADLLIPMFVEGSPAVEEVEVREGGRVLRRGRAPSAWSEVSAPAMLVSASPSAEGWRLAGALGALGGLEPDDPGLDRAADPARLPLDPAGYSGLSWIVLDGPLPPRDARAALLTWAKLGGALILLNTPPKDREAPDVAAWTEARFAVEAPAVSYAPRPEGILTAGEAGRWFQVGRGLLIVADPALDDQGSDLAMALRERPDPVSWFGDAVRDRDDLAEAAQALPTRTIGLLLIGAALLLGPGNLALLRRAGRPTLLLATAPALAALCAGGLLAWWCLAQGLETRAASFSITILDTRDHTAATLAWRRVFAGMERELRPRPGTWVVPAVPLAPGASLRAASGPGYAALAGDLLPPRVVADLVVASAGPAAGLGDGPLWSSGLIPEDELPLEVVAREADGSWVLLLYDGASARPLALPSYEEARSRLGVGSTMLGPYPPPPGSYLVRLRADPSADDLGLRPEDVGGERWVLGILPGE